MAFRDFIPKEWLKVEKKVQTGIDEIQSLFIPPTACIEEHGHENQWEVWIRISHKEAYICLKGETHQLKNNSGIAMVLMAIKGHNDCTYKELEEFFRGLGFKVYHGSLITE